MRHFLGGAKTLIMLAIITIALGVVWKHYEEKVTSHAYKASRTPKFVSIGPPEEKERVIDGFKINDIRVMKNHWTREFAVWTRFDVEATSRANLPMEVRLNGKEIQTLLPNKNGVDWLTTNSISGNTIEYRLPDWSKGDQLTIRMRQKMP